MYAVLNECLPANRTLINGNEQYKLSNYATMVSTQFEHIQNSNNTWHIVAIQTSMVDSEIGILAR